MDYLMGVRGKDFVMVVSDTTAVQQIITIKHDEVPSCLLMTMLDITDYRLLLLMLRCCRALILFVVEPGREMASTVVD